VHDPRVIPRGDGKIAIDVDPGRLCGVSAETIAHGIGGIHEYDAWIFASADWDAAERTLDLEEDELVELDARHHDESSFFDAAWEFEREYLPLELGVSGVARALCAAGCPTFASCHGHDDGIRNEPWVLFATDEQRLGPIVEMARAAGCGLAMEDGLVVAYANSVVETIALGREIVARRDAFGLFERHVDAHHLAAMLDEYAER
jgi:hypothetical protein